jgi:hypothetical protein
VILREIAGQTAMRVQAKCFSGADRWKSSARFNFDQTAAARARLHNSNEEVEKKNAGRTSGPAFGSSLDF